MILCSKMTFALFLLIYCFLTKDLYSIFEVEAVDQSEVSSRHLGTEYYGRGPTEYKLALHLYFLSFFVGLMMMPWCIDMNFICKVISVGKT